MLPKDNTEESTGLDNHLYEPLNSENKGKTRAKIDFVKSLLFLIFSPIPELISHWYLLKQ